MFGALYMGNGRLQQLFDVQGYAALFSLIFLAVHRLVVPFGQWVSLLQLPSLD